MFVVPSEEYYTFDLQLKMNDHEKERTVAAVAFIKAVVNKKSKNNIEYEILSIHFDIEY
jgi:hypothetical protein